MPSAFFSVMQKQISDFVWAGGKARCNPQTLIKHKTTGSMGIPILKGYYMASILDQTKYWFSDPDSKHWSQLKFAWLHQKSPQSLLIATKILPVKETTTHPTIQASLQAWEYLKLKGCTSQLNLDVPIPLDSLQWVIPDLSVSNWKHHGILHLTDIFSGGKQMSFPKVIDKISPPDRIIFLLMLKSPHFAINNKSLLLKC